tara:strand:+ start:330 stop:704 length:375 start_codon:yes stop_codon:yes gene_type:complete
MQFINECVTNLNVGILAEFNNDGKIQGYTNSRIIGVISRVYQTELLNDDDTTTVINVAEVTTAGWCNNVILSGSASWKGCELYANGNRLSSTINGDIIARLIPRTLGEEQLDFKDGDLVTVVVL